MLKNRFEDFLEKYADLQPTDLDALKLEVYPGSAPPEEIADLLSNLSILYQKMGGSGINFTPEFEMPE